MTSVSGCCGTSARAPRASGRRSWIQSQVPGAATNGWGGTGASSSTASRVPRDRHFLQLQPVAHAVAAVKDLAPSAHTGRPKALTFPAAQRFDRHAELKRKVEAAYPAAEKCRRSRSPGCFRCRHLLSPLHHPDWVELQGHEAQAARGGGKAQGGTGNATCVPPLISLVFSGSVRGFLVSRHRDPNRLPAPMAGRLGPVAYGSPTLADIRQHLRGFRGWQGGIDLLKPRHPLISLEIYWIGTGIRLCGGIGRAERPRFRVLARCGFRTNPNKTRGGAMLAHQCHPAPPRHPDACGSLDRCANLRLCRRRKGDHPCSSVLN